MQGCHCFAAKKGNSVWLGTNDKSISLHCTVNAVKFYKSYFHSVVIILSLYFLNAEV